jgi:hypothetical protein
MAWLRSKAGNSTSDQQRKAGLLQMGRPACFLLINRAGKAWKGKGYGSTAARSRQKRITPKAFPFLTAILRLSAESIAGRPAGARKFAALHR